MKIYIGKYVDYIGPYQISEKVGKLFNLSENRVDTVQEYLSDSKVWTKMFSFIDKHRKRVSYIKIDKYDSYNANNTLATIIHPVLLSLQKNKHGASNVDYSDVPLDLLPSKKEINLYNKEGKKDKNFFKRWDWVLNEMIFATHSYVDTSWEDQFYSGKHDIVWEDIPDTDLVEMKTGKNDTFKFDKKGYKLYNDRIANGMRLFGKYYSHLWD